MRESLEPKDHPMLNGLLDLAEAGSGDAADISLIEHLAQRYRANLPAILADDGDRELRVDDLLNDDLDLGDYENPAVLAFVAIFDPYCSTAVAAAARLAPRTVSRPRLLAVVALVNRTSRHREVRTVTAVLTELGPTVDALGLLRTMAREAIAADRAQTDAALCRYLNQLGSGGLVPEDPVGDLLGFAHRLSLSPGMLDRILRAIVESRKTCLKTRIAVIRGLLRWPRPVRLSLATTVTRLPPGPEGDCLKLVLARTIEAASAAPAVADTGRDDPDIPWAPDWIARRDRAPARAPVRSVRDVLRNHRSRSALR